MDLHVSLSCSWPSHSNSKFVFSWNNFFELLSWESLEMQKTLLTSAPARNKILFARTGKMFGCGKNR